MLLDTMARLLRRMPGHGGDGELPDSSDTTAARSAFAAIVYWLAILHQGCKNLRQDACRSAWQAQVRALLQEVELWQSAAERSPTTADGLQQVCVPLPPSRQALAGMRAGISSSHNVNQMHGPDCCSVRPGGSHPVWVAGGGGAGGGHVAGAAGRQAAARVPGAAAAAPPGHTAAALPGRAPRQVTSRAARHRPRAAEREHPSSLWQHVCQLLVEMH